MRTRIFKALQDGKIVNKIAIYNEDGNQVDCCVIHYDFDLKADFYYPNNPHDKFGLFKGRIKDAIECIRDGYGDAIKNTALLGFSHTDVVRYIDRSIGDEYRNKSLEGFKNTKFTYGIQFKSCDSFGNGFVVASNKNITQYKETSDGLITFNTEEDANDFIKDVEDVATKLMDSYSKLSDDNDIKSWFETIVDKYGSYSIYLQTFLGKKESLDAGKIKYYMKPIQLIYVEEEV